jgi:hypothetical protein
MVAIAFLGGWSCSKGSERAERKDSAGNGIEAGQDWSAGKAGSKAGSSTGDREFSEGELRAFGREALTRYEKCGVPPTLKPEQLKSVPEGFDPYSGMPPPDNDFPLKASITPAKGDPGTITKITVVAAGQPKVRVVMVARFFDGDHHGMRAAKVADLTGRTTFEGPVPEDASKGLAYIYISASTQEEEPKSALKSLKFIVTGPGCN